jgi:hypothetical protein
MRFFHNKSITWLECQGKIGTIHRLVDRGLGIEKICYFYIDEIYSNRTLNAFLPLVEDLKLVEG